VPIYEYRCRDCGSTSEVFLRGKDSQAGSCPGCGSPNLEKLISASYTIMAGPRPSGGTCCGREERCDSPPCSGEHGCQCH
jgi:putative FmdB family regulatory protein